MPAAMRGETVNTSNSAILYRSKVRLWRQHDELRRESRRFLKLTGCFRRSPRRVAALIRDWERLRRSVAAHATQEEGLLKGRKLFEELKAQHKRIKAIGRRVGKALPGKDPANSHRLEEVAREWQGALLLHFLFEEQTVLVGVPSEEIRETLPAPVRP